MIAGQQLPVLFVTLQRRNVGKERNFLLQSLALLFRTLQGRSYKPSQVIPSDTLVVFPKFSKCVRPHIFILHLTHSSGHASFNDIPYVADKESLNEQTQTWNLRHLKLSQKLSRTVISAAVWSSVVTQDANRLFVPRFVASTAAVRWRCAVCSIAVVTRLKGEADFHFEQMADAQVVHGISYLL
jgi:hypothetical protein